MVATSNRPPDHLYHKGLQRTEFLPFIHQLKDRTYVHSLQNSSTDYRLLRVRTPANREPGFGCCVSAPQPWLRRSFK